MAVHRSWELVSNQASILFVRRPEAAAKTGWPKGHENTHTLTLRSCTRTSLHAVASYSMVACSAELMRLCAGSTAPVVPDTSERVGMRIGPRARSTHRPCSLIPRTTTYHAHTVYTSYRNCQSCFVRVCAPPASRTSARRGGSHKSLSKALGQRCTMKNGQKRRDNDNIGIQFTPEFLGEVLPPARAPSSSLCLVSHHLVRSHPNNWVSRFLPNT